MALKPVKLKIISYYCDECNTKYSKFEKECSWCRIREPYEKIKKKLDIIIKDINSNCTVDYNISNEEIEIDIESGNFTVKMNYGNFENKKLMKKYIKNYIKEFNDYFKIIEKKSKLMKTIYEKFYDEKFDEIIKEVEN